MHKIHKNAHVWEFGPKHSQLPVLRAYSRIKKITEKCIIEVHHLQLARQALAAKICKIAYIHDSLEP